MIHHSGHHASTPLSRANSFPDISGIQPPSSHPSSLSPTSTAQPAAAAILPNPSPPPENGESMDVQTQPYTAPKSWPKPTNPPARGRGGRGRGRGREGAVKTGTQWVGGEGGDQNDENIPGDPDIVQVHPPTAAQRCQIAAYNKILKNVTPNLDGLYPLMNFGPPPPDAEPLLGLKRSCKVSKLGDRTTAYCVPSADELKEAEEARKQEATQRALKWGGECV